MRVLHVYQSYVSRSMGGLELAIEQIAEATKNTLCEPQVYFLDHQTRVTEGRTIVEVRGKLWRTVWSMALPTLSGWKRLGKALKQADIIHYHSPWPISDLAHLFFRPSVPTVVTYHADLVRQARVEPAYAPVRDAFFRRVDRIVITTPTYASASRALRPFESKTVCIPLCLADNADRSFPEFRSHSQPFILFIGVLRYYKGLDSLLSAAKWTGIPVKIVGDGEQMQTLRKRIETEGIANVELYGRVPELEKRELLSQCSALVLPSTSRAEAFGMVLLEAMRASKPVITTNIDSGMRYVCEANVTGLTVGPNDPVELGKAMLMLVNSPELARRMGEAGRNRYLSHFTPDVVGRKYLELYQQLLRERDT